jgi:tetratricopeptide (TPR) repeat protein
VSTLEAALAKDVRHPGANHLYIHAVEGSKDPARGIPAADRLGPMMPNAGHLVHMPSHIYERVGRYGDAAEANRLAIDADRRYLEAIAPRRPPEVYAMYLAHNHQFLAEAAAMQGRGAEAIEAAKHALPMVAAMTEHMPAGEVYLAQPIVTMARFAKWSDVLAESPPDPRFATATSLYHYARGLALVATGRPVEAKQELAALDTVARDVPPDQPSMNSKAADVIGIARLVLQAKIAENAGDTRSAIARLEEASLREDGLAYDEPPDWWYPVRWDLGTTLLRAGQAARAEKAFRADLAQHPHDGWALSGLSKALAAQGKRAESRSVLAEARDAWKDADVPLP